MIDASQRTLSEALPPYDIAILGAGPGGYVAAIQAAQRGARVALVEADRVGGTCLNRGCIPTKAMVKDAELCRELASGQFGVDLPGGFRVNYAKLVARREQVVNTLVGGVEQLLKNHGVTHVRGRGCLVSPDRMRVEADGQSRELQARHIIVATGSVPDEVPIPGTDLPGVVTSDGLLAMETLPKSLVVIGGSTVGIEFACVYAALGTRVTILGRRSFLKDAETQLARRFRVLLRQQGIDLTIGLEFTGITQTHEGLLQVGYEVRGKAAVAEGEVVLLATGRRPYTEGLGLEALGVAMHGRAIEVNTRMQTNVPGVYAIGDCVGGYFLAHVASYEGEVAVDNILGRPRVADYTVVPNCIFSIPEIAGVGLTEEQARAQGLEVRVSRFPFHVNGRALALGEAEGQIRMICEADADGRGGRVLGVHAMGPRASDLIAEAALALRKGCTAEEIAQTIHQHPTVPEALMEVAMAQGHGAIHYQHRG